MGHIITAVIGTGVLALPQSIAWMGWIGGLSILALMAIITWYTSLLLCNLTVINGVRQRTYMETVLTLYGQWGSIFIGIVQYINLWLSGLAYSITGGQSIANIAYLSCDVGNDSYICQNNVWVFVCMFGLCSLVLSFLPNLDSVWWVSAIGAIMSFGYSFTVVGYSADYIAENGVNTDDTLGGISASSATKAFSILNALGAVVFAYSFSFILVEIADTVKTDKRGPVWHIRMGTHTSMFIITGFYFIVGILGFLAFGNELSECGDILMCFSSPKGPLIMANTMVVFHLLPAFQVYSQPIFALVDKHVAPKMPIDMLRKKAPFRICFRTAYVLLTTFLGCLMPFFNDIVGLVGAIGFWPATVLFPVLATLKLKKKDLSTSWKVLLHSINVLCFILTLGAIIGSVRSIITDASSYEIFGSQ